MNATKTISLPTRVLCVIGIPIITFSINISRGILMKLGVIVPVMTAVADSPLGRKRGRGSIAMDSW